MASQKAKRIVMFVGLFLALPVAIAGALMPQNLEQEASAPTAKPNILFIEVENQRADLLPEMRWVNSHLGARGVTFTNAHTVDSIDREGLESSLSNAGYVILPTPSGSTADEIATEATEQLGAQNKPFYLHVRFPVLTAGTECEITDSGLSDAVNEADVSDKPRAIRVLPLLSQEELSTAYANRRSQVCAFHEVDTAIGQMVDSLGSDITNTIIVYTGTNGYAWGEHRLQGKDCGYGVCTNVPLVISHPRLTTTPVISAELVQTGDIVPTIQQLVGSTAVVTDTQAVSLVPLITRPDVAVRTSLHIASGTANGIRMKDFLYYEHGTGEREFYDLVADPDELQNQVTNRDYAGMVKTLSEETNQINPN